MQWFDIDTKGLAQLVQGRGKELICNELIANAWDADEVSEVRLQAERIGTSPYVRITVEDDSPAGFARLKDAFTVFAPSQRKGDAGKRGRFNVGEKLTIAMCRRAEICTTTGTVTFDEGGRRERRNGRPAGSRFTGEVRLNQAELQELLDHARSLISPAGIRTFINDTLLPERNAIRTFVARLPTELADAEGMLRPTERQCEVRLYGPLPGEEPSLYEMGIPVVATADRWHVDVQQKVPLNINRDNVRPSYLARVRALVLENLHEQLQQEDANSTWVRDAIQKHGEDLPSEAVEKVLDLRFGARRVAYDPSDHEANKIAVSEGYTVVHGSQLSRAEWHAARKHALLPAAGQVTPSPRPYGDNPAPAGSDDRRVDPSKWTPAMKQVAAFALSLAPDLVGRPIQVSIVSDAAWPFLATFGPAAPLTLNLGRLGHKWFEGPLEPITELLIHEFSHQRVSDHLSREFADEHARLGALLVRMALDDPERFDLRGEAAERLQMRAA